MINDVAIGVGYRKTEPPRYPARELRRGIAGLAQVHIEYAADGKVVSAKPAGAPAPSDRFMRAALNAAKDWVVESQRVAGHGVAGTVTVPMRFALARGDSLQGDGEGEINFRDGGKLRVYLVDQPQDSLADSQVKVRSFGAAQAPFGDAGAL